MQCGCCVDSVLVQLMVPPVTADNAEKLKLKTEENKKCEAISKALVWSTGARVEGKLVGVVVDNDIAKLVNTNPKAPPALINNKKDKKKKKQAPGDAGPTLNSDLLSLGSNASMLMRQITRYIHHPPSIKGEERQNQNNTAAQPLASKADAAPAEGAEGAAAEGAAAATRKKARRFPVSEIRIEMTGESTSDEVPVYILGHGMGATAAFSCAILQPGRFRGVLATSPMLGYANTLRGTIPPCCGCWASTWAPWLRCLLGCRMCCFRSCHNSGETRQ